MSVPTPVSDLRDLYQRESARIQHAFQTTADGPAAARERAALTDHLVSELFHRHLREREKIALVAVGGYGRQQLLPASDIDLLFLCESEPNDICKEGIRTLSRELWDM